MFFPIPAPCQVSCDSGVDTTVPLLGISYLTPVFRPPVPVRAPVSYRKWPQLPVRYNEGATDYREAYVGRTSVA